MVYVIPNVRLDPFAERGYPGKYHSATTVATTTTASFTGSSAGTVEDHGYGAGAIMIGAGANVVASKIFVAGGGVINGNDLVVGTVYEISPVQVQSTGGNIFVLKRQQ